MCRRVVWDVHPRLLRGGAVLLLLAVVAGCPKAERERPTTFPDKGQVEALVLNLNPDPEEFPRFFTDDAVPSDSRREQYGEYSLKPTSVSVDGESATVTVEFQDENGTVVGEQEWTAVKVGDEWRLKTAPLP